MYYGSAQVTEFRRDLPILMVRAGLDRPPVNRAITELVNLASNQNAPVTLVNYPGGHHGFEIVDDEDATREVIDGTIDFVKRMTSPAYQASLAARPGRVDGGCARIERQLRRGGGGLCRSRQGEAR